MRLFVLFALLTHSFVFAQADLSSPRATFKTFLKAMVQIKQDENVEENYAKAASTLNLSHIDPAAKKEAGRKISEALVNVLDRMEKVDYEEIPDQIQEDFWVYDKRTVLFNGESRSAQISLQKENDKWFFSKETIQSLPAYQIGLKDAEIAQGVVALETWRAKLRGQLPAWSQKSFLGLEGWQWVGLLFIIFIAYIFEKIISVVGRKAINNNFAVFKSTPNEVIKKATVPFGKIILLYIVFANLYLLDLDPGELALLKRTIYVLSAMASVWLGHRVVEIFSFYFHEKSKATASKFDDILVPLVAKTAFVFVYLFGVVIIAHSFTVDVTGILAGLGIGGLAFAFAAKDTLANFFGSIMLVLDRPFDIGDYIKTGDIEGIVVEVGFRSTRVRTFYDSIITVSNGELMNKAIDNRGKRRYRRLNSTLGLEYDTPPEKVEAFCEGIRQLILNHKWTRKDYFNVYFTNFGASSLDIQLMVFWDTDDYSREQSEKHRLMVDILRLAKELEVGFAFPTQTVHLFQEQTKPAHKIPEKYLDEGIGRAKNLAGRPLTLKNPRSNANDEEQFGKNDVGI